MDIICVLILMNSFDYIWLFIKVISKLESYKLTFIFDNLQLRKLVAKGLQILWVSLPEAADAPDSRRRSILTIQDGSVSIITKIP